MKRKLVKQGNNALTVTLPKKWLDKYNLKAGNEVFIKEHEPEIIITAKPVDKEKKETIYLDKYKNILQKYIHSLYRQGVTEIEITYSDPQLINQVHKIISKNIIGYEIIEQHKNKAIIKSVAEIKEGNYDIMFRRIFRINNSMFESIENQESLESLEKTNNKLCNYCRRYISKRLYEGQTALLNYLVIETQERIGDELLFLKKLSNKFSSTEINYLKIAKEFYELSQKIYFNDNPHEISNEAIKYNDMIDKLLKSDCSDVIKHYLSNIFHHTGQILSYRLQLMFLDK